MAQNLHALPKLLVDEPALGQVVGRSAAILAVPEPARAIVIAGLACVSSRRPIVVATPTSTDAERLVRDLQAFLGEHAVELFPAWETLPFERVSPSIETMGRRLRTLWRLRDPERIPEDVGEDSGRGAPRVIVAPARALVQRLGPHVEDVEPIVVGQGDRLDLDELVEGLVAAGYRREYQVEHRGEMAVRGSIVDVFPSTADGPVRIDLWGDEVDRLSEFSVADQRSTVVVSEVEIFPCREVMATDEVRARAEKLVAEEPWGREQWERLSEGLTFDGMESWLPWLVEDEERVLFDLLHADAQILLVEPRRMRDRAADVLAEERDLARTLARTWGAITDEEAAADATAAATTTTTDAAPRFPCLHVDFDRLLAKTEAPAWTVAAAPESPDTATVAAAGWNPVVGDGAGLVNQLRQLITDGYRIVVGADGAGSAGRLDQILNEQGLHFAMDLDGTTKLTEPGGVITVAPLERGFILPSVKLAMLSESDVTGRRRAHRRARPRKQAAQGFFDDLKPGDHVVHYQHGVAR